MEFVGQFCNVNNLVARRKEPIFHSLILQLFIECLLCKILHLIPMCVGGKDGGSHTTKQVILQHQLSVLQFISILRLSNQRWHHFHRVRAQSHMTALHHHFRCQSQTQVITCASDQRTIRWKFQKHPP